MRKALIIVMILLLAMIASAGLTNIQHINNVYDTNKCYLIEPKAFIDEDSNLQLFGLIPEEVHRVAPEMVILQDPFLPFHPDTNPIVSVNYTLLSTYCLEPFRQMKIHTDDLNSQVEALQQKIVDMNMALNAKKNLVTMGIGSSISMTCDAMCDNLDDTPPGSNYACVDAMTLLGGTSSCTSSLLTGTCICQEQ